MRRFICKPRDRELYHLLMQPLDNDPSCRTCKRPEPQRLGDPQYGTCPACGSTLGGTLDNGQPFFFLAFSQEVC